MTTKQGDLTQLNTTDKTSLVNALKEVKNQAVTNQNAITGMGQLKFIGVYATLSDLQTAYPSGINGIALVTADGYGYYWNGLGSWTKGSQFQSTGLADGSVTVDKTDFIVKGKNLFNKASATIGYYVNQASGDLAASSSYNASDFIPVSSSTQYAISKVNSSTRIAYYNSSKGFISGALNPGSIITTPANTKYIRFSFSASDTDAQQFELGSAVTSYEPFGYKLAKPLPLDDNSIGYKKTNFVNLGKNLFDKNTATSGYYVNNTNGNLAANSAHFSSDFIPVSGNQNYYISGSGSIRIAYYDANQVYISGASPLVNPFVTPSNAAYIRFSESLAFLDTAQVELGTVPTPYEQYGYKLAKEGKRPDDDFLLFLPSEICVAVGRTIEIYNNQVAWTGNLDNYHFQWDCTIGKSMKRKFSVTGQTVGTYTLTLNVFDNNMRLFKSATATINVVSNSVSPFSLVNIGDSLTNNKAWLQELINLSSNQITLVGTRGSSPTKHEGRSGFSAANYLSNTAYTFETPTETVHPFWDGTRFNWNYYKTNTGINPNAIQIFLGTNGIDIDPTVNAGNIKQMVDYIRQDDANIPIFLVYTLYRGNQDGLGNQTSTDGYASNKGAWKLQEDRKVFNLMSKLNSLLNAYSNLYFVPIAPCHDSEFNFGAVSTPVNPRANQTELLPTEATHPQTQGYLQMADIMYSVLCKVY
jgi:plastocyanin